MREAITVQAPRNVRVEMETMEMPDSFLPIDQTVITTESEPARKRKSSQSMRNILSCRTVDIEEPEDEFLSGVEFFEPSMLTANANEHAKTSNSSNALCRKRASLVLRTRRHNEPIIRVRQGTAVLRNLELKHVSLGIGKCICYPSYKLRCVGFFVQISFSVMFLNRYMEWQRGSTDPTP